MKVISRLPLTVGLFGLAACAAACGGVSNQGQPGATAVSHPNVPGTVFTIVFENHDESAVTGGSHATYFDELAAQYGSSAAYLDMGIHPSLPNYIVMTSGLQNDIHDDNDPGMHHIAGEENLPSQLQAANIPWRSYQESMGDPCKLVSEGQYAAKHDPFVYYDTMYNNPDVCRQHVVDFEQNFATDLAANTYRYMWITPNMCNDMHDCSVDTADAWLRRVIPQIQASPGYQNGGAIFILWDEGSIPLFGRQANLASLVISPNLVSSGYRSDVTYTHRSYLATVEDILGLPRLASTADATPMADFFTSTTGTTTATGTTGTGSTTTPSNGSSQAAQ